MLKRLNAATAAQMQRPATVRAPIPVPAPTPPADPAVIIDQALQASLMPVLLTPRQAAAKLCVTEKTLERWRANGTGPKYAKFSAGTIRYVEDDVIEFVLGSLKENTAQ